MENNRKGQWFSCNPIHFHSLLAYDEAFSIPCTKFPFCNIWWSSILKDAGWHAHVSDGYSRKPRKRSISTSFNKYTNFIKHLIFSLKWNAITKHPRDTVKLSTTKISKYQSLSNIQKKDVYITSICKICTKNMGSLLKMLTERDSYVNVPCRPGSSWDQHSADGRPST